MTVVHKSKNLISSFLLIIFDIVEMTSACNDLLFISVPGTKIKNSDRGRKRSTLVDHPQRMILSENIRTSYVYRFDAKCLAKCQ